MVLSSPIGGDVKVILFMKRIFGGPCSRLFEGEAELRRMGDLCEPRHEFARATATFSSFGAWPSWKLKVDRNNGPWLARRY